MSFTSPEDALEFVRKLIFPFTCQGLLLLNVNTFESLKLVNKEYQEYFDIRGCNIPSVPFAYLHIMADHNKVQKFRRIISEKDTDTINKYDAILKDLVEELHALYICRYVKKDHEMKTDQTKHKFLLTLHEWFKAERDRLFKSNDKSNGAVVKIKVTQKIVADVLFGSDPPVINKLIREKIRPPTPSTTPSTSSSQNNSPAQTPTSSTNNSPVRER